MKIMSQNQVSNFAEITGIMDADSLSVTLRATLPLVQYLKKGTTDGFMPNWATAANQPIIYPNAMSQLEGTRKNVVAGSEVWSYNDTMIIFNSVGVSVTPAIIAGVFKKVIYDNGDFDVPGLRIINNLVSPNNVDTDKIGMGFKTQVSGIQIPANASIDIRLEETVGDPYQGYISATDGGVIDNDTPSTTLTSFLMKGGNKVITGVTYKWFKAVLGGWEAIAANPSKPNEIKRTANDIDTYSIIKCEFWIDGMMVFAATKTISDETDPLVLVTNPSGTQQLTKGASVTYTPKVVRRATGVVDATYNKLSFTTYNATGDVITLPTGQIVANKSIRITRADVDNAKNKVRVHFNASK